MVRVSEYIEQAARRIRHRVRTSRAGWWLLGIAVLVLAIGGAFILESSAVRMQDASNPVACARLLFGPNEARCERMLIAAYGPLPALERAPLCAQDRERFGAASALCEEYDDVQSAQLHNESLNTQGISVWEPVAPVPVTGTLRVKALEPVSSLTLVCDNAIVPSNWTQDERLRITYTLERNATCTIIAMTAQGSITSAEFSLVAE